MKMRVRRSLLFGAFAVAVLGFQNCSDFSLQDQVLYEQGLFASQQALDAETLPSLLESDELLVWSKPDNSEYIKKNIYANQVSFVIAADRAVQGRLLVVNSGSGLEELSVSVVDGNIKASRKSSAYEEYLEATLPGEGDKMVLAVAFGAKTSEISLLVNGIVQTGEIQKAGTTTDLTYLLKQLSSEVSSGVLYEYVIFGGDSGANKGRLSNLEMNVMSRYIANGTQIANVVFDPALINGSGDSTVGTGGTGTGGGTVAESSQFLAAKAIFDAKCISCHKAGGKSPDMVNLTEAKALSLGIVVKGNPAASLLYNSLKGASASSGRKDMPLGDSISSAEVQVVADWINSIP